MSLVTEAPSWLYLLCIVAGVTYSGALYFKDRFNRTYGIKLASLLAICRFIVVSLLAFFLLKPLLKSIDREVQKPIVVIAQDNSQSLMIGNDSAYYNGVYKQEFQKLMDQLKTDYEVRTYSFGDKIAEGIDSLDFNDQLTDFSSLLEELNTRYSGRNLGALVIASDGLYNKGSNPVHSYQKLNVPVYTVALGDTTVHKDVLLSEVAANRLAYLGNKFPVQITVEARKAMGNNAVVSVSRNGQVLYSEALSFTGDHFFKNINVVLDANTVGLQKYSVNVSSIPDEITLVNNHTDIFIDVLDSRQRVLILAAMPHPDISALVDAIGSNEGYAVEAKLIDDFSGDLSDFNLVIFHQLPARGNLGLNHVKESISKKIPSLFVWGSATDFQAFNELRIGYSLADYRNNVTDAGGTIVPGFSLFEVNEELPGLVKTLPPVAVPFGEFNFSPGIVSLIHQQVGNINTNKPLLSFNPSDDRKVALLAGEGIWRWRLQVFRETNSHDLFNELITKTVQYMSSREDKSLFRVSGKNDFPENENIVFNAELYNASYEPISDREVSMKIRNEEGEEFSYLFSPGAVGYQLDAGSLPVGNYSYVASATSDGKPLKESGEFSVSPLEYEMTRTVADHRLLNQLAVNNQGAMVYPEALSSLNELIRAKKEIVPVSYETKTVTDLINYSWLLALFIILLGGEWLLRKRAGTY